MSDLMKRFEKQAYRIELLEEELRAANHALEEKSEFAAGLELDLENAIQQLQNLHITTRSSSNPILHPD